MFPEMIYLLYSAVTEPTASCKVIGFAERHTFTWGCFDSKKTTSEQTDTNEKIYCSVLNL